MHILHKKEGLITRIIKLIKSAFITQKDYFDEHAKEIAARNLELIKSISGVAVFVYCLFFIITNVFFKEWAISLLYALIVPVLIFFYICSHKILKNDNINPKKVANITLFMHIALMAECVALSVFPHPDVPSVFFPLFLILGPVLFIMPIRKQILLTFISVGVFTWLTIKYKSPLVWHHELFEVYTASIFALVVIFTMTQFRFQTDKLKMEYYQLSQIDKLSGLLNKVSGLDSVKDYLEDGNHEEKFAILFIDLDDFKRINDTYGHMQGDKIIEEISKSIKSLCSENSIACRFGGDEFFVFLKKIPNSHYAVSFAEGIIDGCKKLTKKYSFKISTSIGICYCESKNKSLDTLMKRADVALYQAKQHGKNRFELIE